MPKKPKPQPRAHYGFDKMEINDVKRFDAIDGFGRRAQIAAYAYARRNGLTFCTGLETKRGVTKMLVRRVA